MSRVASLQNITLPITSSALASPRALAMPSPSALTCWMVVLPVMVWYRWMVNEGIVFTTRDSRTTSRT